MTEPIPHRQTIVLATTNPGKLNEMRRMLADVPVNLLSLAEFDPVTEPVENGVSFRENARIKADYYSRVLDSWVIADDSGLEIDVLNGEPGVCSARFADSSDPDRKQRDRANYEKVLDLMRDVPAPQRTARFRCALCLRTPTDLLLEVEGVMEGVIAERPNGENGFGYDPIFIVSDLGRTAAELSPAEKNARSHRGQAVKKLHNLLGGILTDPHKFVR